MSERIHPYDLVFGGGDFETKVFPELREEAETRGVDMFERDRLLMLERAGELLRSLLPPDAQGTAYEQFGAIVMHAFHYWLSGKQTFAFDEAAVRELLDPATTIGAWDMTPPAPAGFVQLPRNLLFARVEEGGQAEAVDGFFFLMPGGNDAAVPPYERLDVLLVLGLVPRREGFSIVEVSTPITADAAGHFGDAEAREDGVDFANVLPGGEKLFALTNELEVLKLASRCFWRVSR